MKILLTGSFGNLGIMCIEQALKLGFQVRCFDLDTRHNRKVAHRFGSRIETVWGDICQLDGKPKLLDGIDAIIHNACILPPMTDRFPERSHAINVKATETLIRLAESQRKKPRFVYPSSVTVFGYSNLKQPMKRVNDPTQASDHYTRHKLSVEELLRRSDLEWVVLRIGVSVDARTLYADRSTMRKLFAIHPETPLEYVHPKDVALAMCRAAQEKGLRNRLCLVGGGESCRTTQREFIKTAFNALGLSLPRSVHGNETFYTHWMQSEESNQLLNFQYHSFEDYRSEVAWRLRYARMALLPVRGLANRLLPKLISRI